MFYKMLTSLVMPHIQSLLSLFSKGVINSFITEISGGMLLFFKVQFLELSYFQSLAQEHEGWQIQKTTAREGGKGKKKDIKEMLHKSSLDLSISDTFQSDF